MFYKDSSPGKIASLGLAQMYKLPYRLSLHQARDNSSHHHGSDIPDFVETLFGFANDDENTPGLRGRISFGHAFCNQANPPPAEELTVILNGPKPSYYPNYIRQQTDDSGKRLANAQGYATLMDVNAELRGWKRYPAKPFQQPNGVNVSAVTSTLHPLREGASFTGKLRFHNLRPQELGGLVWALTWGWQAGLAHGLGMGKPLGYGQVSIELGNSSLRYNGVVLSLQDCVKRFVADMETAFRRPGSGGWRESAQIRALLAMADPLQVDGKDLTHMRLDHLAQPQINNFTEAKNARWVLEDYVPLVAPPKSRSPTLARLLSEVMKTNNIIKEDDALRGQPLAKAWATLQDEQEKAAVKNEILAIWQENGWWDNPDTGAKKKAKAIYEGG